MRLDPQNGTRRTREQMDEFQVAIIQTIRRVRPPVTLRQLFYAMLPLQLYPKTEQAYKNLCYHTARLRRKGVVPYAWFSDNTRWQRKPQTYNGLEEMLEIAAETYRRALWVEQNTHVEIWIEKDALASFFVQITDQYDVALMVTRGFPSMSFVYESAQQIKHIGKATFIYYFGDYDPSGVLISTDLEKKLREHGARVTFTRVAVNHAQIKEWELPTRPTKRSGSHAKSFASAESVELDAVPPEKLRLLIQSCITQHLPFDEFARLREIEQIERETLSAMIEGLP